MVFAMILWLKIYNAITAWIERGGRLIYVQNQSIIINNEFIFRPLWQQIKSFNFEFVIHVMLWNVNNNNPNLL